MFACDLLRRLHQHRCWVNRKLLASVQPLTLDQLHRPLAIGQGSVWKTLTLLLGAEYVWLAALEGDESPVMPGDAPDRLPGNQQGDDPILTLDELARRWQQLELRWTQYLDRLEDHSLSELVYKVSTSSDAGTRPGLRRSDVLMHVCTHAHYTVAQLVNMLRQLEVAKLPDVMLISLAREESIPQSQVPHD